MIAKAAAVASSAPGPVSAPRTFSAALAPPRAAPSTASVRKVAAGPEIARESHSGVQPRTAERAGVARAGAAAPGARLAGEILAAQARLDRILKLAESGRSFTPAQLVALQAHAYRASQELDLASKVVEKGTAAVKQTLQTQL